MSVSTGENELSSLTRHASQTAAGDVVVCVRKRKHGRTCNATQRGVDWQMKIDDARTKLKSLPDN
jgi:hypothetical protein